MKCFIQIFAFYFALLAFQPVVTCGSGCGHEDNTMEIEASSCHHSSDTEDSDCTSSNCHCVCCCISIVQLHTPSKLKSDKRLSPDWTEANFAYTNPISSPFTNLIWQPPKS